MCCNYLGVRVGRDGKELCIKSTLVGCEVMPWLIWQLSANLQSAVGDRTPFDHNVVMALCYLRSKMRSVLARICYVDASRELYMLTFSITNPTWASNFKIYSTVGTYSLHMLVVSPTSGCPQIPMRYGCSVNSYLSRDLLVNRSTDIQNVNSLERDIQARHLVFDTEWRRVSRSPPIGGFSCWLSIAAGRSNSF